MSTLHMQQSVRRGKEGTKSKVGPPPVALHQTHLRHPCRAVGVAGNETLGDLPPHVGMTCASCQCFLQLGHPWVAAAEVSHPHPCCGLAPGATVANACIALCGGVGWCACAGMSMSLS